MRIFFLVGVFLLCSCNNNKNCSYKEAVQRGEIKDYKTSSILINDSLNFKLDYVRDQLYKEKDSFCFGNLELDGEQFSIISKTLSSQYDPANVRIINILCEDKDLCKGEAIELQNIKGYLIYYINKDKKVFLDYVNLLTGDKETYPVSDSYATVKMYFLMKRSGIKKNPSCIDIKNRGFTYKSEDILMIKKSEDTLYKRINEL